MPGKYNMNVLVCLTLSLKHFSNLMQFIHCKHCVVVICISVKW